MATCRTIQSNSRLIIEVARLRHASEVDVTQKSVVGWVARQTDTCGDTGMTIVWALLASSQHVVGKVPSRTVDTARTISQKIKVWSTSSADLKRFALKTIGPTRLSYLGQVIIKSNSRNASSIAVEHSVVDCQVAGGAVPYVVAGVAVIGTVLAYVGAVVL